MVGDASRHRVALGHRADLVEQLGHVADLRREGLCPVRVPGDIPQQVPVLLHGRPAAGDVDHHVLHVGALEAVDERLGPVDGLLLPARVAGQRPAALLPGRGDDVAALRRQHPGGGGVHVAEEHPLDAAGQHADPAAPGADGGRERGLPGHDGPEAQRREQGVEGLQPLGQTLQQAQAQQQPLDAEPLVDGAGQRRRPQPGRVREQAEDQCPEGPVGGGPFPVAFDLRTDRLDELVVLDPGRTGGDAGHAPQAGVEVLDELRVHVDLTGLAELHQVDATARRVRLVALEDVRRTGGQAEPAVHAVVDGLVAGRVEGVEDARRPLDRAVAVVVAVLGRARPGGRVR